MVGFECRNILKHFLELTLNLFSAYASWYVIFHPIRGLRAISDFDLTIIEYPHRFKVGSPTGIRIKKKRVFFLEISKILRF